jgi:hypothetical protein
MLALLSDPNILEVLHQIENNTRNTDMGICACCLLLAGILIFNRR